MKIILSHDYVAPRQYRWLALLREYDLDDPVGSGPTPLAAVADLLWHLDIEDIDPEQCDLVWSD